jgi:hypothetical protein
MIVLTLLKIFRNGKMRKFKCMILYRGSKVVFVTKANERNSIKSIAAKYKVCEKKGEID